MAGKIKVDDTKPVENKKEEEKEDDGDEIPF